MSHSHDHDPIEQINNRHRNELLTIARTLGATPDATGARAEHVDATGVDIAIESPDGSTTRHVAFLDPIDDYPTGLRVAFVRLARHATNRLNNPTEHS